MLRKNLLPSLLAISLLLPLASLANDTSVGVQSGQVMPIKSSTLRLLREDLHISLSPQKVIVEVCFRLQNVGRPFHDPELRKDFSSQPWYQLDPKYTDAKLNEIELRNVRIILDYQQRRRLMW